MVTEVLVPDAILVSVGGFGVEPFGPYPKRILYVWHINIIVIL
jgi:hypothetical protein